MMKLFKLSVLTLLLSLLLSTTGVSGQTNNDLFTQGVEKLTARSFSEKEEAVENISQSNHPRAGETLEAVLESKLFYTKKDKRIVYADKDGSNYTLTDFFTGELLGKVKKRKIKKVRINNKLRRQLKSSIAELNLKHKDPKIRLAAVDVLIRNLTSENLVLLSKYHSLEKNKKVLDSIATALALGELKNENEKNRLEALNTLRGNLHPVVKNKIVSIIENDKNPQVVTAAKKILISIESKVEWFGRLETIFFGMSLGSVLVLAAIGLAITFGVIGVINMAHGELIMLGAYTTYVMQKLMPDSIGLALALSVPAAFCVAGLIGILIERSVIRYLYGRPLETLLATFGISLVLQQTVRSIFSPLNRAVATPEWMSGSLSINPILSLTTNRVVIFIFAMIVFAGLFLLLKKSSLGLQVRAVAQNRSMARAMGIHAARVDALTFGLGSGIAGIAGVALSQLTNVGPNLGQAYIIDSFMVVVFGGVGNLWGTLIGGLSLGVANKFLEPWSGAVLAKIFILVFIILFIQKRPQGLFPQKGRAAE